jgi:hypothetical protein
MRVRPIIECPTSEVPGPLRNSSLSSISFEIDPHAVLGVPPGATLEQIRDAYRKKSKSLHPDVGGEDWAFRVLVQSYEMLCTARVMRATRAEPPRAGTVPRAARPDEPSTETLRGGIHDHNVPAARMIGVEHLCVRYLWDEAAYLWLSQKQNDNERFLSCSLNLNWPDQGGDGLLDDDKEARRIVSTLEEVFDHMVVATRVISSRSHVEDLQFAGWLSYSGFDRSWKALKSLHDAVLSRGLGIRQWSRDLYIPKTWK